MKTHRILVVGSGGREHALAWRLSRDAEVEDVWVAPGNDGLERDARRAAVGELDAAALAAWAAEHAIDLVVIGPEAPLAAGVADVLRARGLLVYGPSAAAARIESSKWFAKEVLAEAGVPTPRAESCADLDAVRASLARRDAPWVLKADGLAAGKGVCVTARREEAEEFARDCLERRRFGDAGARVLVEDHVAGVEASVMAVCDGARCVVLPAARDWKRARDGDRGANTGGMGAVAPHADVDAARARAIADEVIEPVLATLANRGAPFVGTLYAGVMLGAEGVQVLEFNCRFGDPETEAVMPLVGGSFARLLADAARGALEPGTPARIDGAAVAVALVADGYPEAPAAGGTITGLDALGAGVHVFHAGTERHGDGWRVRGGRAAYVVAHAADRAAARARAYEAVARLGGDGWRCRSDIGAQSGSTSPMSVPAEAGGGR